jgi:rubrerythrin
MFVFGTAEDVFIMAIRFKESGEQFYRRAANRSEDPVLKNLFQDLATLEECHIQCFSSLRSQLSGSFPADAVWDPEGLAKSYLEAAADTHIFAEGAAIERLEDAATPLEALDMAIQFEKDTVHFLLGMKEMLPDPEGKRDLDKLICEETNHIRMLSQAKKQCLPTKCEIIS